MGNLDKRIGDLERRAEPPGKTIVIYGPDDQDPTPEQIADFERKKQEARERAGPQDHVLVVEYVDWPPGAEKNEPKKS